MGHGKGAEMEQLRLCKNFRPDIVPAKQHIRTRIAVEGEIPVAVFFRLHKSKGGSGIFVHTQIGGVDTHFLQNGFQFPAKQILSHLADKARLMAKLRQHGQHITGRSARIGLEKCIALPRHAVIRHIDQQLS